MMTIAFRGWFQCRFAIDPDPSDDPRGVSGPTFVVPGEPPFDRIVRLQDFVCPRWPRTAADGVYVTQVTVGDAPVSGHPLVGAKVSLGRDTQFQQRNLILVEQPWLTPIDPFDLTIAKDDMVVRRTALFDVTRPKLTVADVFLDPKLLNPRLNTASVQSPAVAEATGVMDYSETRVQRRKGLVEILERTTDPVARAALEKRIRGIDNDAVLVGQMLAATQFMGMQAIYQYPLNGQPTVRDPGKRLGGTLGTSQLWCLAFWLGGYDVDTLCGFMEGTLAVPFLPAPAG
jgi:hypothetical protein